MIDLNSIDFIGNPYPAYKELRERDEPTWMPHELNNGTDGISLAVNCG